MSKALENAIEAALLKVADNVAKHIVQRSGWHPDDKCFQIDLREAQQIILLAIQQELTSYTSFLQEDNRRLQEQINEWRQDAIERSRFHD